MRRIYLPVLVVLWVALGSAVLSAEPRAVIVGPSSAAVGQMVAIDSLGSVGSNPVWSISPPVPTFPIDGGKAIAFRLAENRAYAVALAVTEDGKASVAVIIVQAGQGPNPPPPPPPTPDFSDSVKTWAESLIPASPTRAATCQKVAASFRSIASQIDAGTLTSPENVIAATKASNDAILGTEQPAWAPFSAKLSEALQAMDAAGKLGAMPEVSATWKLVAKGLEAVR